jgi:Gamma-glutamyltranspeptidase
MLDGVFSGAKAVAASSFRRADSSMWQCCQGFCVPCTIRCPIAADADVLESAISCSRDPGENACCVYIYRRHRDRATTIDFSNSTAWSSCSLATRSWASPSLLMRYCNSAPTGGNSFVTVKDSGPPQVCYYSPIGAYSRPAGGGRGSALLRLWRVLQLEKTIPDSIAAELARRGHELQRRAEPLGGCQAVWIDHSSGFLMGASEPRKDGIALGYWSLSAKSSSDMTVNMYLS